MAPDPFPAVFRVTPSPSPPPFFSISLKLEQFRVLLVGGEKAGLATLQTILRHCPGSTVAVVAPSLLPELAALAAQYPRVQFHARPYADNDLDGQDFVFVATDDPALSHRVITAAAARRLLLNVAGSPEESNFHLAPAGQPVHVEKAISSPEAAPNAGLPLRSMQEMTTPGPTYRPAPESPATAYWRRVATGALATFALFILVNIASYYFTVGQVGALLKSSGMFYTFIAVGFVAQLIDGMLGMGYGVVSAISLMSLGLSPVSVSASIHTAEMFASGASGYQHYRFGNVNKKLFRVLLLPGVAGSVGGALLLSHYGEQHAGWIRPILAVYLLILGLRIIGKAALKQRERRRKVKNAGWLAGAGGFLDSFGGGGWGPLVTSTLITNGRTPRYVIGTVSLVEFFVTFASAFTFFALKGLSHWQIVAGLIVGGVAAAPIAARLAGRIPTRWMFLGVGLMVIVWSLWALRKLFLS
jgi:siroheme synthase-like protein